ncbi:MAG TPA: alpha/beta hydrolase [Burkholderiales bacterium]|nr:alpha/beta hydrolase [Burkholderiales bacterium]
MAALYRGMDRAALDAAYNNSVAVTDSPGILADWQARSDVLRRRSKEIRYGAAERNRIDLFDIGKPLLVFIHGGYWQMRAKENFAFLAAGPLAHGISVALIGYTLAPEKRLDGIVAEIRAALDFLARDCVVSGWSAGGHLTAMVMDHPRVRAGLAISGIYDLEPIRLCYLNEKLGLDETEARRNTPLYRPPSGKPLILAYGTHELPELQRHSVDYAKAMSAQLRPLGGHNHFTILEELASPTGALNGVVRTFLDV